MGAGCASRPESRAWVAELNRERSSEFPKALRAKETLSHRYPRSYRCVQRAVLTVRGRQFTLDGVLTARPGEGHHLAVVSALGVVTDVRLGADGACEVQKVTPLMREQWSRDYVGRDLQLLFATPRTLEYGGRMTDGRLLLVAGPDASGLVLRYAFTPEGDRWEEVEMSRAGRRLYHARVLRYGPAKGSPAELPSAFEVVAETYRLFVQVAEWRVEATPDGGGESGGGP